MKGKVILKDFENQPLYAGILHAHCAVQMRSELNAV